MNEQELRDRILLMLDEHSKTGLSEMLEDKTIASATKQTLIDVQRQIRILESQGKARVEESMGPRLGAIITPGGMLAAEKLEKK